MTVGERIKSARIDAGMTQEELGKKIGVNKEAIHKYEKGLVENIPLPKFQALADALEVDAAWLAGWVDTANDAPSEDDLHEYLDMLRTRPEMRLFLDTVKGATKEQVEENVRFLEALRASRGDT